MNNRVYNFGAGPGVLPLSALKEAQEEFINWQDTGVSILEIGHRTKEFSDLLKEAEYNLRELINIPDNYHVLFIGCAARLQFSMIPMNLLNSNETAGYIVSGIWSNLAFEEALRSHNVYCVNDNIKYNKIPAKNTLSIKDDTRYVYYTPNETIHGLSFDYLPEFKNIPLIADMTSCLLAMPFDVSKFAMIFAGAQKNISGAGLTIVIIRDDLLTKTRDSIIPTMLDYNTHIQTGSLYATPPVFNCYIAQKTFKWIKQSGGVEKIHEINQKKAKLLYDYIDSSTAYHNEINPANRSIINICFYLKNPDLDKIFVSEAKNQGLYALNGHKRAGGIRASLYNAMPVAGVNALIEYMRDFAKKYQL